MEFNWLFRVAGIAFILGWLRLIHSAFNLPTLATIAKQINAVGHSMITIPIMSSYTFIALDREDPSILSKARIYLCSLPTIRSWLKRMECLRAIVLGIYGPSVLVTYSLAYWIGKNKIEMEGIEYCKDVSTVNIVLQCADIVLALGTILFLVIGVQHIFISRKWSHTEVTILELDHS